MLANIMTESSWCFWKCDRKSGPPGCLYNDFPEILGKLLYYLHLPSGANDLSGESWQLITSIHDEGDGLTLCEQHS